MFRYIFLFHLLYCAGKSDLEVAAMMDTNGDGELTKDELKHGVVDLKGIALDKITSDEIDLVWDTVLGSTAVIDLQGGIVI